MHRGYVKLWRKAFDSGLHRNHMAFTAWMWILGHAAHKPHRQIVGSTFVDLKPGQLVVGRKSLSVELGMSERNIRTVLQLLEKCENVTIKPTNKYSILTVVNWELYQAEDIQATNKPTSSRPAPDQPPTTIKNEKNEKHEERNPKGNSATAKPAAGSEEESLLTKSGKRLTGKRLTAFKRLWDAFADKRGKAEAADAWARIPQLTDSLVEIIVEAAQAYAVHARPSILASGGTPKMLQGWITARRWEDDLSTSARSANGLDAIATWSPKEITQ